MSDSVTNQRQYNNKEKIASALMAVFPTVESYKAFIEDDKEDIGPFINIARKWSIIGTTENESALEAYIEKNSRRPDECMPPAGLKTLSEIFEDQEKIGRSVRGLTSWINKLIKDFDLGYLMPAV